LAQQISAAMNLDTPPEEPGPLVPKTEEFEKAVWRRDDDAEELAAFMAHLHEFMNQRGYVLNV